jgi:diguanylate cyclase (GGDEF)-like protein
MVTPHVEIELLSELAETDPLTLLRNRRHLEKRFPVEFAAAMRHGRPLAVIALDLDRFKRVNDKHGHPVGDEVLVEVARRMEKACRPTDIVARVGGEEFILLLPETDARAAYTTARRILSALRSEAMQTQAGALSVTASAGVCAARAYDDLRALIERVDDLLYRAKDYGRDRVIAELERAPASEANRKRDGAA